VSRGGGWREDDARVTSEVARRAIRRLDVLEWVILAVAAGLAVGGGWLVAWMLAGTSEAFRTVWMVTSLLLFVVPGAIAFARLKRDERKTKAERRG
jgi:hypothetical protein